MRILFLDCFSGISGDMTVAALCEVGADPEHIRKGLSMLGISGEFHLHFSRQTRCGIDALKFDVHCSHDHHHHHGHGDHAHNHGRTFASIRALLQQCDLSEDVRRRAVAVFVRIAEAEGKIHGLPAEEVHFHEVGAVDSIVDIVATCLALESLGWPEVRCSELAEGSGFVECAHGRFPLPAPATLEILSGITIRQLPESGERITPTGAAIAAEFASGFGPMPPMAVARVGYGAGTRNPAEYPNVLRAVLGESAAVAGRGSVTEISTNLDDLSPELVSAAVEKLLGAGAFDAFVTPILMKKGRPAFKLSVLADPARADEFATLILRETSAFGVRMHTCQRLTLRREIVEVGTAFGPIAVKRGWLDGEMIQATPEFESCRAAAEKADVPVRVVYEAAASVARS